MHSIKIERQNHLAIIFGKKKRKKKPFINLEKKIIYYNYWLRNGFSIALKCYCENIHIDHSIGYWYINYGESIILV